MMDKKNIVLALCGYHPQIITEFLFCLVLRQNLELSSLRILTTDECAVGLVDRLNSEFRQMELIYSVSLPILSSADIIIIDSDISNPQCYHSTKNTIFELIGNLSEGDDSVLHLLISGGFKTMSADAAVAMSIYGRLDDKMYHILCDKEFAESKKYFPTDHTEATMLNLIEMPFIRLRPKIGLNPKNDYSYDAIIKHTQNKIDIMPDVHSLEILESMRRIKIGEKEIELAPVQFAVYLFFARQDGFIRGGKNFTEENSQQIWTIYDRIATSAGQKSRVASSSISSQGFGFEYVQKSISLIAQRIRAELGDAYNCDNYIIKRKGAYADKWYGISIPFNMRIFNMKENIDV